MRPFYYAMSLHSLDFKLYPGIIRIQHLLRGINEISASNFQKSRYSVEHDAFIALILSEDSGKSGQKLLIGLVVLYLPIN